ncbi:hypothetical protein HER10_EVM0010759 [Colletotrichum scovillei]|uniref:uncharacterized protein n=1 Tax=Colletotrichum scovillei TaxID=1209932 RepID=UPI0015C385BE|nr:uncharacterized protein HER10_EVM0010759 [Colletotrichum scovillei]KAF4774245.1 hypothetical protein HER10_EVM0010759 [Colletotrichum scovillei]
MATSPDKDLTQETIYDEEWWVKNTREHPDSPISLPLSPSPQPASSGDSNDTDTSDHTNTSNISIPATAIHTHDTTAATITSLRPPGNPHAPLFLGAPPVKPANKGQWAYVEYIPAWTDPLWKDGDSRVQDEKNPAYVVRKRDWTKTIRPAQLPQDRAQNPSAFALRYGVYPDRLDGRSRLTPTRGAFRTFKYDGVEVPGVTAEVVIKQAEGFANAAGLAGVDGLLEVYSGMRGGGGDENERFVLRALEGMRDDEDWQMVMFRGMTSHELIEGGMMSMRNGNACDLKNDLHKDKWVESTWRGCDPEKPRLVYQSGQVKGEWDPRTNDYLWEKMQPALLLASRILTHLDKNDPFWRRLHDVLNRQTIGEPHDYRTPEMRKKNPIVKFTLHDYADGGGQNAIVDDETRKDMFDVHFEVLRVLQTRMRFMVCRGYKDEDGGTAGVTCVAGSCIDVHIAADALWPLVVPGYSDDERLMQGFFLASTIVHEIAHAVNYAHHLVLLPPACFEVETWKATPDKVKKASEIGSKMFSKFSDGHIEPFFEDEPQAELGFCIENRLFGGVTWNIISPEIPYLFFLPAAMAMERWPRPKGDCRRPSLEKLQKSPERLVLDQIPLPSDQYFSPTRVVHIVRLFTEAFWGVEVNKYGPAALRFGGLDPVKLPILWPRIQLSAALRGVLAPRGDRALELLPRSDSEEMLDAGPTLHRFLYQVGTEFLRPNVVRYRWERDHKHFVHTRNGQMILHMFQLAVIVIETDIAYNLRQNTEDVDNRRKSRAWLRSWKKAETRRWGSNLDKSLQHAQSSSNGKLCPLPHRSVHPLQDEDYFWQNIPDLGTRAGQRTAEVLRRVYEMIIFEIACFQQIFIDIYHLDDAELEAFQATKAPEDLDWRLTFTTDLGTEALRQATRLVADYGGTGFIPAVNMAVLHDFVGKFTNMRAQLEEMKPWAENLSEINPSNYNLLQPIIPRLKIARRPVTARMVKIVQKELGMLPVETLVVVEKFLSFVKTTVKAAGQVKIDLARDYEMDLDEVVTEFEKRDKLDQPDLVEDAADEDDPEDGLADNDPLTEIIRKRKPKNPWNGMNHPPKRLKRPRIAAPQLVPQPLAHPTPFSRYSPPRHRFGDTTKASRFSRRNIVNAVPDPMSKIPNVFANIPDISFPLSQSPSGFAGYGPGQQQPPPQLPTHASVFGKPGIRIAEGPEPMGIFPHAYALSASFTEDLEHEARARLMLAQQSPANSAFGFRERHGATLANAYRDPLPVIPDSPERHTTGAAPNFGVGGGNRRRRIPDPQDYSPTTEEVSSLSSYPGSTPRNVVRGNGAVGPRDVDAVDEDERWRITSTNRANALNMQREMDIKQGAKEKIEEQKRQQREWLNSLARQQASTGMLEMDMGPDFGTGPLGEGSSASTGGLDERVGSGPSTASHRQQARYLPNDMDWVPG